MTSLLACCDVIVADVRPHGVDVADQQDAAAAAGQAAVSSQWWSGQRAGGLPAAATAGSAQPDQPAPAQQVNRSVTSYLLHFWKLKILGIQR